MDKQQKRERSANFSQEETNLLVYLVENKKQIVENKKSDATTWQEKEKAWKEIEKSFNSASGTIFRDRKHLKLKYEAMKRETRKKSAAIRADNYKTGGGTSTAPPLTTAEEKIKTMIILSVDGNESQFDSDFVVPSTSTISSITTWVPAEEESQDPPLKIRSTDLIENIDIQIQEQASKPLIEAVCVESEKENLRTGETENKSQPRTQWNDWSPAALKSKKHPALTKPKEKRPFDKLAEEKLEIAKIQKKILTEELEQKVIQRKILEKELEHKIIIQELEKQEHLLKIEILKKELENK